MIKEINVTDDSLIAAIYTDVGGLGITNPFADENTMENDIFVLRFNEESYIITVVKNGKLVKINEVKYKGIKGDNIEQRVYLHYLNDPDIVGIICTGEAGSGKTFLAMAAAFMGVVNGNFNSIVLSRPPVAPSKKFQTGFLPGTLEEKMRPWLEVFYDNLRKIKFLGGVSKSVKVDIREQSLEYIKGLNFDHSIVIVDEAEDLTKQEIKAILTRTGTNSKVLLLGDEGQTTETGCKRALFDTIQAFRKPSIDLERQRMFAAIDLRTSLRSPFVNYVLEVLK